MIEAGRSGDNETGDDRVLRAVRGAREAGLSWDQISELLGVSRREARRRYAKVVERPRVSKRQLKRAARAKRANLRARG